MEVLYENIRKRREELGMSQDELAHKVGYTSRSTIARIERGDINIPQDKIILFARALRVLPEYLMGWAEDEGMDISDEDIAVAEARQKLAERPDLKALLDAGSKLSDEDIANVIRIMEAMSK